ncbi:hypothetical protein KKA00_04520 [bacterium]|nr:hypothetical protein [bacterium]MBU1651459.1 hypothetical protein [bacterium]
MTETCGTLTIGSYDYDDHLIEEVLRTRQPRLKVYRAPLTAVVIGRGGKPDIELHLDAIARDGVPVLRRNGGGCAVVIDAGNLVVSVALPVNGIKDNRKYFDRITDWLIGKLQETGLESVQQRGISDLAIGDRKIGGSCIYRTNQYLYYSTTILLTADLSLIDRYLKHPPREPDYRYSRPHLDFVMNVGEMEGLEDRDWGDESLSLIPDKTE